MSAVADVDREGDGSEALAADTGGFSVRNTNDFAAGAVRIGQESRSYYLLGYNPGDVPRDGRFRKIEVKVRGRGLTVRARRGYYAPSAAAQAPAPQDKHPTEPDLQRTLDAPGVVPAHPSAPDGLRAAGDDARPRPRRAGRRGGHREARAGDGGRPRRHHARHAAGGRAPGERRVRARRPAGAARAQAGAARRARLVLVPARGRAEARLPPGEADRARRGAARCWAA